MEEKKGHPATIDEYIARFPGDVQQILVKFRAVIREAAPEAVERIAYDMPAYYQNGFLLSFAAWKKHIAFYPRTVVMDVSIPELSAYKGTKGSVHFPLDQPLPYELIGKIVKARIGENLKK
jgi:uncharacterized protein YdhG (YjbR/CyaY superfamily)